MTIFSFNEVTWFLLNQGGVSAVYARSFCQDPLEQHSGRHWGINRWNDNPTLWAYGYQEQKFRLQRGLALTMQPLGSNLPFCSLGPVPKT